VEEVDTIVRSSTFLLVARHNPAEAICTDKISRGRSVATAASQMLYLNIKARPVQLPNAAR